MSQSNDIAENLIGKI